MGSREARRGPQPPQAAVQQLRRRRGLPEGVSSGVSKRRLATVNRQAEASLRCLGEDEAHVTLPLRPLPPGDENAPVGRAGRYMLSVLQCVGHFLREGEGGGEGEGWVAASECE